MRDHFSTPPLLDISPPVVGKRQGHWKRRELKRISQEDVRLNDEDGFRFSIRDRPEYTAGKAGRVRDRIQSTSTFRSTWTGYSLATLLIAILYSPASFRPFHGRVSRPYSACVPATGAPTLCPTTRAGRAPSPRTDGVLSPPNPSSPTPCATSNARAPVRLNLPLTTPLATKTHPRNEFPSPNTVRSAPNPLLQTMNPGLAKQKMAVV